MDEYLVELAQKLCRPDETHEEWEARTGGVAAMPDPFARFRTTPEQEA